MTLAFVGLGSNLRDPPRQLDLALATLAQAAGLRVGEVSAYYRSAALGSETQPDYCNAVAALESQLTPRGLLECLLDIERGQGRLRMPGEKWAARTLDLDLLSFAGTQLREPGLELPHPRAQERAFVMIPWAQIAPGFIIPGQGRVGELASRLPASDLSLWR